MRGRWRQHPPRWWPENEAWPPVDPRYRWRHGRTRFVRGAGCFFAAVLLFVALPSTLLIWRAAGQSSGGNWFAAFIPIAFTVFPALLVIFMIAMGRLGRPMGEIVAAADRVASGDLESTVPESGPPWLRRVARAFNSMTGALRKNEEQRRHLMADIAHELRTPLAVMQGRLEGLLDGVYARDDARLTELLEDTRLLARLVEDLRTLAHAESGALHLRRESTDLGLLIHEAARMMSGPAAAGHVTLSVAVPDLPLIDVDPLRMREVLTNIVANAIRHTPAGGTVTVAAAVAASAVEITVRDTGSGIAPEDLPRIFDRFFKGSSSSGSGLGLTIARNLVEAHGGTIVASSAVGAGTTITVKVPRDGRPLDKVSYV